MGDKNSGGDRQADALDQQIYNQFYEAGAAGIDYNWTGAADREIGAQKGYAEGQASVPAPGPEMPDFAGMFEGLAAQEAESQAIFEQQLIERDELLATQQADAERALNEGRVGQLYSSKFAAANAAADRVNEMIAEERGYAKVGGADYSISDAEKKERINNTFAGLWSAEQESELSGLESEWGSAGNKWTSDIVRGVAEEDNTASDPGASAGKPVTPAAVFSKDDDEDDKKTLGGVKATLGGA